MTEWKQAEIVEWREFKRVAGRVLDEAADRARTMATA